MIAKPQTPPSPKRDASTVSSERRLGTFQDSSQTSPIGYRYTGAQWTPKPAESQPKPVQPKFETQRPD